MDMNYISIRSFVIGLTLPVATAIFKSCSEFALNAVKPLLYTRLVKSLYEISQKNEKYLVLFRKITTHCKIINQISCTKYGSIQ